MSDGSQFGSDATLNIFVPEIYGDQNSYHVVPRPVEVPLDVLGRSIDKLFDDLHDVFSNAAVKPINGFALDHMELGLNVGADGSIGVASLNANASIMLSFRKNK